MAKLPVKKAPTKQRTVKEAFDSLQGQTNTPISGVVARDGEPFTKELTPEPPPVLTLEQQHEKQTLIKVLDKWLVPAQTTTKIDPERDHASLMAKLRAQTLDDLWKFFDVEIPAEVKEYMQSKYRDISP